MAQGPMSSVLVTIRITVRIHESEVRNLHLYQNGPLTKTAHAKGKNGP